MSGLAIAPPGMQAGFLGAPFTPLKALEADFAVLGIPHGVPYNVRLQAGAPLDAPEFPLVYPH